MEHLIKEFQDAVDYFKAAMEYFKGKNEISYKDETAFESSLDSVTDATATALSALIRLARAWRAIPRASRHATFAGLKEDDDALN